MDAGRRRRILGQELDEIYFLYRKDRIFDYYLRCFWFHNRRFWFHNRRFWRLWYRCAGYRYRKDRIFDCFWLNYGSLWCLRCAHRRSFWFLLLGARILAADFVVLTGSDITISMLGSHRHNATSSQVPKFDRVHCILQPSY
jgi:hypothetical protein